MALQRLSGWGRTAWTVADLFHTNDVHEMQQIIDGSGARGVIAR
jgi:hypothetical protein